jgi:hypothetical protein
MVITARDCISWEDAPGWQQDLALISLFSPVGFARYGDEAAAILRISGNAESPGRIALRTARASGNEVHGHHYLPEKFGAWFKSRGIDDINYYVGPLTPGQHVRAGSGVHSGPYEQSWNGRWEAWIAQNQNASPAQVVDQARALSEEFRIPWYWDQ